MSRTRRSIAVLALATGLGLVLAAPGAAQEPDTSSAVPDSARTIRVKILGMSCPFCAYGVEQKLKGLEGVVELDVDLASGIATLAMEEEADVSNRELRETVDDAGFEAAAIVRSFASGFQDWNPGKIPRPPAAGKDTTPS